MRYTAYVDPARFSRFRRAILRAGGRIVVSSPIGAGYSVTYTIPGGAR